MNRASPGLTSAYEISVESIDMFYFVEFALGADFCDALREHKIVVLFPRL